MVDRLLLHGADLLARTNYGETPADLAANNNNPKISANLIATEGNLLEPFFDTAPLREGKQATSGSINPRNRPETIQGTAGNPTRPMTMMRTRALALEAQIAGKFSTKGAAESAVSCSETLEVDLTTASATGKRNLL